ncbi:MAG: rod shape-determining protein [Patescibacteria group bacterium]|nr:rod shape-determining protein [Patescibacteria group bacterium]
MRGKKALDNYAISLDIGTEFVKTLIFKVANDKAEIIGVGRQRQKLTDMQGGMVMDIHGVIKNCESSLEMAAEQAGLLPDQVIIGIAGELVKGITTTIKYTRPRPKTKITMLELKDIITRVQRRAFDRARSILAWETGHGEIDVKLVNAAVVDVRIDGYKVNNPLGFQGKEIQIGIFNAFAPIVHLGALQTIAQNLELDLLSITAEPYAVAGSFAPDEGSEFSAIFIDVGGGTSDIAVVNSGGVVGTKMFALGGRAFTKRIAQVMGLSFADAESLKIKYAKGEITGEKKKIIKNALALDCDVWISGVELTLEEFKNVDLLPSRILLCGGGSSLPDLVETLKAKKWSKHLPFARKPTIHYIKPKNITSVIDKTNELKNPCDITPMAMASLAIELVGEERVVDGLLSRVVSSLGK